MIRRYRETAERIREELAGLERVVARAERAMCLARQRPEDQDLYFDSAALNLHDFYTGVERIFRHIASTIDRALPTGRDWHQELLRQMAEERPGIRPAVISDETLDSLDEYRRFRHVVRNIYAFQFDPVRLERLVRALSTAFTRARGELEAFADFLARLATVDAEASSEGPEPPRDELRYQ